MNHGLTYRSRTDLIVLINAEPAENPEAYRTGTVSLPLQKIFQVAEGSWTESYQMGGGDLRTFPQDQRK